MRGIMDNLNGMIIKLTGGFYYVEAARTGYMRAKRGASSATRGTPRA